MTCDKVPINEREVEVTQGCLRWLIEFKVPLSPDALLLPGLPRTSEGPWAASRPEAEATGGTEEQRDGACFSAKP